jgi:hypothetical protein
MHTCSLLVQFPILSVNYLHVMSFPDRRPMCRLASDCDGQIPSPRYFAVAHDKHRISWWLHLSEGGVVECELRSDSCANGDAMHSHLLHSLARITAL